MPNARHGRQHHALPESTVCRLTGQLDALVTILKGVDTSALRNRPKSGKWSAHENLAHLGRYHEIFLTRLERILAENRPELGRYRAEEDPEAARWFALSTARVLRRIRRLRKELIERLSRLDDAQLARTGVHPSLGEMALPLWIEFFLAHEGHHLYITLQRARENPPLRRNTARKPRSGQAS